MTELALRILREVRDAIQTTYPDDMDPIISLVVDYPKEGEIVTSDHYALRVGAGVRLRNVEISINGGDWHRCRASEGFWWYDWHSYLPGSKFVLARATSPTGDKVITARRRFKVQLP
jgi:hypothetical protein